ncbi:MAG: hypothetical protein DRP93_08605, partial [Candidatus Neomarinimicrobiota bacterium]
ATLPAVSISDEQLAKIDRELSDEQVEEYLALIGRKKQLTYALQEYKSLMDKARKQQLVLEARKVLRRFFDYISAPLLKALSLYVTRLLSDTPFAPFELTPDFEFTVMSGRPVSRLSTAQRDLVMVLFRIAVARLLQQTRGLEPAFLLLDSVGDSLDETNFSYLMSILSGTVAQMFKQIIVTSHHA